MFTLALLAGGLATRMAPLSGSLPKALFEVAGRPFIMHVLDHLKAQGVERVVLCVGHLGEQIHDIVRDGKAWGIDAQYCWDGPDLLGTGGALRQALPLLGPEFFVQYGDTYLPIDYSKVWRAYSRGDKPALMTVIRQHHDHDERNVEYADGVVFEYNKTTATARMRHVDYGLSILSSNLFSEVASEGAFDLAELLCGLSLNGKLAGHEVFERYHEIGSPDGLEETIKYFNTRTR
jgi:N-acetyl-alpha-D-muramate 1-phosphate uridylyltransferase